MPRKILPEQSISITSGSSAVVPVGARIIGVKGEADGKTTYDFIVQVIGHNGTTATTLQWKITGTRNGRMVNLWNEVPYLVTTGVTPTAPGLISVGIITGTGVSLQVYYAQGSVAA